MSQVKEAFALVDKIKPLLAHHDPAVQGAALAELLATFIAGHHPALRAQALAEITACAQALIGPNVEQLIESGRAPPEWREGTTQ